jgi:hypothetical protein
MTTPLMSAKVRRQLREVPHEVYCIQHVENPRVKIGVSTDTERRWKRLEQLAGVKGTRAVEQKTRILAVIPCPDARSAYALESELLEQFKDVTVGGEIFEMSEALRAFISTLKPYREYRAECLKAAWEKVEAYWQRRALA